MKIECLKKEYVIDSNWIKVRRDYLSINEKQTDYYVVEKKDVALVLAFNKNNEIIIVKEYKYPVDQIMTGIPGGTFSRGEEDPLHAAKRELKEETGCESNEWELLVKTYEYPTKDTHEIFFYIVRNCVQTAELQLDENEELTSQWVPFQNAINMVMTDEIKHGCTAYALLRCAMLYPELLKPSTIV